VPPLVHPSPFPFQSLTLCADGTPCHTIWTVPAYPVKAESGMKAYGDDRCVFSACNFWQTARALPRYDAKNSTGDSRDDLGPQRSQRARVGQITIGRGQIKPGKGQ
jgi:hypothetical protein